MLAALSWLWRMTGAADGLPPAANVVISNVPGPRTPMYAAGAAARHYFPLSIPYHGGALNITVESYLDQLEFGLLACRLTVPRVQVIADYLAEEFYALKHATEALARPEAVETIDIAAGLHAKRPAKRGRAATPPKPAARRRRARKDKTLISAAETAGSPRGGRPG
jgi:hypothetical protein